jgi:ribosomal protein S11
MRKRVKKKKIKFRFRFSWPKTANLVLNKSASNIFLTFSDLQNKVIRCQTAGMSQVGSTKKKKKSPQSIENIVKMLHIFFIKYKIEYFNIVLKTKFSAHIPLLLKELLIRKYKIACIINKRKIAHNGMRGRKMRRI